MTSRSGSSDITCFQPRAPEEARTDHVTNVTEQPKEHVELTRENEVKTSILLTSTKASNKLSIPNSDGTGKIDLKAVTKQTQLFVIFFWLAKL